MHEWGINGDLHVHAHHTACDTHKPGDPVEYGALCGAGAIAEMDAYLAKRDFSYAGIVNHATDPIHPRKPNEASEGKIALHIQAVEKVNRNTPEDALELLHGIEASLLPDGTLDVTHKTLCSLDLVILSRHGGTTAWAIPKVVQVLRPIFEREPIHVLGHPTRYSPPESLKGIEELMELCREFGVAFELNANHPFGTALVEQVVRSGVLISLGSDIHLNMLSEPGKKLDVRDIEEIRRLQDAGLRPERLVNTWSLKKLRRWLSGRTKMCTNTSYGKS